jgi:hypothetical protein
MQCESKVHKTEWWGLQSCLNTMFTQDCKIKCHTWSIIMEIKHSSKSFTKKPSQPMHDRTKGLMQNANAKSG